MLWIYSPIFQFDPWLHDRQQESLCHLHLLWIHALQAECECLVNLGKSICMGLQVTDYYSGLNFSLKLVWLIMTNWRRPPASSDPNSSLQERAPMLALSTMLAWKRSYPIIHFPTCICVVGPMMNEKLRLSSFLETFSNCLCCISALRGAERLPFGWHGSYQWPGSSWSCSFSL